MQQYTVVQAEILGTQGTSFGWMSASSGVLVEWVGQIVKTLG